MEDLLRTGLVVRVREEARQQRRKAGPPVHDDLVQRNFAATAPNRLWLADITEHRTIQAREGKLYLCAIKDIYSNRIVGYSIDSRRSPASRSRPSTTPSRDAMPKESMWPAA